MENRSFSKRYGPWAVVTGASSGIGRELALQIAERGVNLVISGRDTARLEKVAVQAKAKGRQVEWLAADLSSEVGLQALLQLVNDKDVGLLVPAAGFGTGGDFLDTNEAAAVEMIRLNVEAIARLLLHVLPRMRSRGRGAILLVASMFAFHGIPYAGLYAATKAFVQSLGEALAVELADSGLEVVVTSPGPTETGFAARAGMRLPRAMNPADVAAASLAGLGSSKVVLPGALTKLLVHATFGLPRWAKVRIMGRVVRGMT